MSEIEKEEKEKRWEGEQVKHYFRIKTKSWSNEFARASVVLREREK